MRNDDDDEYDDNFDSKYDVEEDDDDDDSDNNSNDVNQVHYYNVSNKERSSFTSWQEEREDWCWKLKR